MLLNYVHLLRKLILTNLAISGMKSAKNGQKFVTVSSTDCFSACKAIKTFSNNVLVQTTQKLSYQLLVKFQLYKANISQVISINMLKDEGIKRKLSCFINYKNSYNDEAC